MKTSRESVLSSLIATYFHTMLPAQTCYPSSFSSHRWCVIRGHAMPYPHRRDEPGCGSPVAGVHEDRNLNA
jgi:hypothetical protein